MGVKTTKVFLGNLDGKDVYAIGPYAQDIKKIVGHQALEIKGLTAELAEAKEDALDAGRYQEYQEYLSEVKND